MTAISRVVLAVSVLAAAPAFAESLPRVPKNTPYAQARKLLLGAGYKPGTPEKLGCAGTGLGQCIFAWEKGASHIEIVTIGERPIVNLVRPAQ